MRAKKNVKIKHEDLLRIIVMDFHFEAKTHNRKQWATTKDDSHEDRSSPSFLDNLSTAGGKMRLNCLTIIRVKEIHGAYYEDIIEASNNDDHILHE